MIPKECTTNFRGDAIVTRMNTTVIMIIMIIITITIMIIMVIMIMMMMMTMMIIRIMNNNVYEYKP